MYYSETTLKGMKAGYKHEGVEAGIEIDEITHKSSGTGEKASSAEESGGGSARWLVGGLVAGAALMIAAPYLAPVLAPSMKIAAVKVAGLKVLKAAAIASA